MGWIVVHSHICWRSFFLCELHLTPRHIEIRSKKWTTISTRQTVDREEQHFDLAGQILPMLTGVLTIPYIVRGLGTDGYGILSIAMMLLGYFISSTSG